MWNVWKKAPRQPTRSKWKGIPGKLRVGIKGERAKCEAGWARRELARNSRCFYLNYFSFNINRGRDERGKPGYNYFKY